MACKITKIKNEVLSILDDVEVEGNIIRLTCGQLDRKMYLEVNKILDAMGGKWNRKEKGHVFDSDPSDKLESVILTGEITTPKDYGFFETPKIIVGKLIALADIRPGMKVLEPSAGQGAIADELNKLDIELKVCELLPENAQVLKDKGYNLRRNDFLSLERSDGLYDRIVMNPPFGKQQDIDHVMHAYALLNSTGRIVSVMSAGVKFRENKKTKEFRELIKATGRIEDLPEGAFRESGTMVKTVIVVLN